MPGRIETGWTPFTQITAGHLRIQQQDAAFQALPAQSRLQLSYMPVLRRLLPVLAALAAAGRDANAASCACTVTAAASAQTTTSKRFIAFSYFMSTLSLTGAPVVTDTACRFSPSCGWRNTTS